MHARLLYFHSLLLQIGYFLSMHNAILGCAGIEDTLQLGTKKGLALLVQSLCSLWCVTLAALNAADPNPHFSRPWRCTSETGTRMFLHQHGEGQEGHGLT